MLRYRRLGKSDARHQILHAAGVADGELAKDPQSHRMGERSKPLRDRLLGRSIFGADRFKA